jgi:hypothetical protein
VSDGGRRRLVALAVLLAIAVPLVAVAVLTRGGEPATGLRIERGTVAGAGTPQLTVYVEDPKANVPETNGGKETVELECLNDAGETVVKSVYPWPFTDTDNGTLVPHVHQNVGRDEAPRITRCRLNGTELEGRF